MRLCFLLLSVPVASGAQGEERVLDLETFRDRLQGGWAGQMIGVSYGEPYEFRAQGQPITEPLREWKPDYLAGSLQQDDLYVEMTFLRALEEHGLHITPEQAGIAFRDSRYPLWHANDAARFNLKQGIMPPQSGHPRYNPHADDIDFQIESDLFGLIAPGLPREAARLCDLFGSIMNYGDGVYGGRFVATMYTRAYLEDGPTPEAVLRCIEAGLAAIPEASAYAKVIRDVLRGYERFPNDWLATWRVIQEKWGEDDLCPEGYQQPFNIDAKLNGAYIVIGLLYGGADLARTLEITTRCGQDADCNPSNAAGILGALYGYRHIPAMYTSGLAQLKGKKFLYTEYDFDGLIAACERMARRLVVRSGGRIERPQEGETFVIPWQPPQPPAQLEQMKAFGLEQLRAWADDFERRRRQALESSGSNPP